MPVAALPPAFTPPPILMYHQVDPRVPRDPVGRDLTVTPVQFEAQLRAMRAMGLAPISLADLDHRLRLHQAVDRTVVVTFDDGYEDQDRYAVPLLRRYGAHATFFIITSDVNDGRHLTWAQLRAMAAEGMEIAGHGVQHHDLSRMTPPQQRYQIDDCIAKLRAHVHVPVTSYAYPSGRLNATTLQLVRDAGITLGVTTDARYVVPPENRLEMTRMRVRGEWNAAEFSAALAGARNEAGSRVVR